ncbi:MAG: NAD(P)/FAD-dependent oxidoreductase [Candidatus Buchananbacteria bacterium]|jgi:hypothetical protein
MKYDVAIIGAGPAGLLAAIHSAELGARVIVIDKNKQPGIKLLMTGGGRCNITNQIEDIRKLAEVYGADGKFLLSAFNKFTPQNVVEFFESRGVKTKAEANGRVFPKSDRAQDVLSALLNYAEKLGVEIKTLTEVREVIVEEDKITKLLLPNNDEVWADNFILATGGRSYFKTGSTGDGYRFLKQLGHKVSDTYPALAPIFVKEKYVAELQGLSLKNVKVSVYSDGKKIISKIGEMIFTKNSLSGPLPQDLSRAVARELPHDVTLKIDFEPDKNSVELDEAMLSCFYENNNKAIKNSLSKFIPPKLIPIILRLCQIDPDKKVNLVTKEERKALINLLKDFNLQIDSIGGYDYAMVTSGGVNLKEIDQKTMRSKLINNLFIVGELLGIDGPTGGYNLQVCWSSGYVAGENAAENA